MIIITILKTNLIKHLICLHTFIHSNKIYNNQEVEQCPSKDEWINKMYYIHTMELLPPYQELVKEVTYDHSLSDKIEGNILWGFPQWLSSK